MSGAPTALVPGTPTNVVGVGVDRLPGSDVIYPGIIQVSWATPSTDGGAPIIKYVVTDRWNSANTCSAWVTPLDPTPTSCAMTGFVAGYGYTFRVVAWNEVGASVASSVSAPAFAGGTPNAPEITGITGGSRSVDVGGGFMNYATATATVSPGATNGRPITGYRLKAVDQSNQYTQYFTSATATIVADQLTAGRSYRLSVQAQNDFGYGDWSPQSSTIYASYPPLAATGVTAVPTEGGATISYSPPSWNGSTATYAVTVNDLTLSTSWTEPAESYSTSVSGLTNGHSYSFAITATNFAGAGPMSGASAPVTPNLMPNAPRNIAPTIGDRSISVAFDAPTSRDGATVTAYKVAVTNISSRAVVFATGAASPIQVSGLTNGAGYQVSVVAVNGAVDGQAATFGSTVTPAGTPVMLQPSPTYYEDGATTVTLTTINLAGGSFIKYTVYVSEATTPLKLVKTVETTTSPVVITGLTNGTRYAIQAKVTTTGGSSSLMTQGGASILPVGRPSAPSILNVVASGTSAAVSIADPASTGGSAITGYTVTATSSTDASRTRTSSGS
jgi:titin